MKFMYLNIHPTRLFGPTRLIGTWEYAESLYISRVLGNQELNLNFVFISEQFFSISLTFMLNQIFSADAKM